MARATKDAPDRDQAMKIKIWLSLLVSMVLLSACVSSTIDEMIFQPSTKMDGRSIVVLGRRHSSDYETEPAFVPKYIFDVAPKPALKATKLS